MFICRKTAIYIIRHKGTKNNDINSKEFVKKGRCIDKKNRKTI